MEHDAAWHVSGQPTVHAIRSPVIVLFDGVRLYRNYFDVEGH
jgi:hypothetical protein